MYQSRVVNGIRHYYEITGEGEWLVLIHGWAGSRLMWKKEVDYLSQYFKVLNYDLRGHGLTGPSSLKKYDLQLISDDLNVLMEELKIKKAHICSLSLGAVVAQGFALFYPEKVKSMVMIGPPGPFKGLTKLIMLGMDKFIGTFMGKRAVLETMAHLVMPTNEDKVSRKCFIQESRKLPESEISKWWDIIKNDKFYSNLSPRSFPTLILIGELDWLYMKEAKKLDKYFPEARVCIIPETGHLVSLQNPSACKEQIIQFYISNRALLPPVTIAV